LEEEKEGTGTGSNIFWGAVFTVLAFVELRRGMLIVSGIPVWALCLFAIGIGNFLKVRRIAAAAAGSSGRVHVVRNVANILIISGLAVLVLTIFVVYLG
jgi:hypothetical protein